MTMESIWLNITPQEDGEISFQRTSVCPLEFGSFPDGLNSTSPYIFWILQCSEKDNLDTHLFKA
ncbi:unnamed protein product [Larinioides sclopetarius]|uniref:Uncharacterized protein n=1 Tax=Larinioides sclopetarius TaxID=280406 RepID=A0AAV1Z8N9_9ARAC